MRRTASALLAALALSGCHYYFEDDATDGASNDGGPVADAGTAPPDAAAGCDPAALLPEGWQPVTSVSTGSVASEVDSEPQHVFLTTVDASAGGASGQATEPAVYLQLGCDGATKVDIDDVSAFESTDWDLALERYVIRTNGGDSGPGGATVARIDSAELTSDPDPTGDYRADDWSASDCTLLQDQIAGPRTRFSSWYEVEGGRLEPQPVVFALRLPGDRRAQVDVQTYYGDPAQPNKSGVYVLRWRMFGCAD